jgi:sugar/nucleoside kinase (ribokinase family)
MFLVQTDLLTYINTHTHTHTLEKSAKINTVWYGVLREMSLNTNILWCHAASTGSYRCFKQSSGPRSLGSWRFKSCGMQHHVTGWLFPDVSKDSSSFILDCLTLKIQATLVIRDLTLRVSAITRFRGKKAVRKLYHVWWWHDCVACAPAGHILPVSVWEGVLS